MNLRWFELAASSFALFCLQVALWRNCDVGPKRVYRVGELWRQNLEE